jgi:hypothetical protein
LLNDQAAVWARLGNSQRARELIARAQALFAGHDDPTARAALAESNHLKARLIFQASAQDTFMSPHTALAHALEAERTYRELDRPRELARTWTTIGRLQALIGQSEAAADSFTTAIEIQEQLGDLTGLAQSTAAIAQLLADNGETARALAWLSHSVALNTEKCSRGGLRYNERALADLARRVAPGAPEAPRIAKLRQLVAERTLRADEACMSTPEGASQAGDSHVAP